MPNLKDIHKRHSTYQDSLIYRFESGLRNVVGKAQSRVISQLHDRLKITDGVIDPSPKNLVLLRNAGKLFMAELDKAGYQELVQAFLKQWNGTLPFLQETIEFLGEQVDQPWKDLKFTSKDLNLLNGIKASTVDMLDSAMTTVAGTAVTRGLFGVAGLRFGALVETLTEKFQLGIGRARSIADTAMSTWYRTAADRAFQAIAADLPQHELKYRYSGPDDKLTRPFCRHMLAVDKAYTRDQIEKMDNGQLPNVFLTCGGWNCRHQWVMDTQGVEEFLKEPAVAQREAA